MSGLQQEPGKNTPLRPSTAKLECASAFVIPQEAGVDLTNNTSRIPLAFTTGPLMDDRNNISLSANFLQLRKGQYKVEFDCAVESAAGAAQGVVLAVTNADGSVVYGETTPATPSIPAGGTVPVAFTVAFHLTADAEVQLRCVSPTSASLGIVEGHPVALITRIGNVNET